MGGQLIALPHHQDDDDDDDDAVALPIFAQSVLGRDLSASVRTSLR